MNEKRSFSKYGIFVWILTILFFFYEFFLRVLPATVAKNIISSLDMSIEQFAFVGSGYYITYSFMQIPVGILLDRFKIRILITFASALCTFGVLWFSFAHSFGPVFISRLLIGLGSSFGFVGLMIVTLNWFPKRHFALLIGCGQFLGAVGPLCAGGPIAYALKAVNGNWRVIFLWVGIVGILLTLLLGIFLRGKPKDKQKIIFIDQKTSIGQRVKNLLNRSQVWWTMLYASSTYVALPLLGAFWGTAYLESKGFSKEHAALTVSMIWVGLAVGSPVFGWLSDALNRRKPVAILCALFGISSSSILLFTSVSNEIALCLIFFCIGLAGSGQNLSFALISEHVSKSLRATAFGLNNTAIMGLAATLPPFVTSVIRGFTSGGELTEAAFERGFLIIPICFSAALLVAIFGLKETFCRQQNTVHKITPSQNY